jgi:hypothetical protein
MGIKRIQGKGLRISLDEYRPLKAFQAGGYFWDEQPQQILRESLGEFLPVVLYHSDTEKDHVTFTETSGEAQLLCDSAPCGRDKIPSEILDRLHEGVRRLKMRAAETEVQPAAKEIIKKFMLPDPLASPELYRMSGPWWNRRLFILWGCERLGDTSISPDTAVGLLQRDKWYVQRRASLYALCGLFLALVLAWWILPAYRRWSNKIPVAKIEVDRIDVESRVVTISDGGSLDSDGRIVRWIIDWGDGITEETTQAPVRVTRSYVKSGSYVIRLSCYDDEGAACNPPAMAAVALPELVVAASGVSSPESDHHSVLGSKQSLETKRNYPDPSVQTPIRSSESNAIQGAGSEKAVEPSNMGSTNLKTDNGNKTAPSHDNSIVEPHGGNTSQNHPGVGAEKRQPDLRDSTLTANGPHKSEVPNAVNNEAPKANEDAVANENSRTPDNSSALKSGDDVQQPLPVGNLVIRQVGSPIVHQSGEITVRLTVVDIQNTVSRFKVVQWDIAGNRIDQAEMETTATLTSGDHVVIATVRLLDGKTIAIEAVVSVQTDTKKIVTGNVVVRPLPDK